MFSVGHTIKRCPNPPAEDNGEGGEGNFDAGSAGADEFSSAPPADNFDAGATGGDQAWNNDAAAASGGW